eukprot:5639466-Alexandrium_andersonii.AAC.1
MVREVKRHDGWSEIKFAPGFQLSPARPVESACQVHPDYDVLQLLGPGSATNAWPERMAGARKRAVRWVLEA